MNIRDQLQEKWANEFVSSGGQGILHLCPRSGKIRTSIRIFCKYQRIYGYRPKILICYPDKNIQKAWEDDISAVRYKNPDINYVTHVSMYKEAPGSYDIVVCDEIHLLSEKQKRDFNKLFN